MIWTLLVVVGVIVLLWGVYRAVDAFLNWVVTGR